MKTSSSRHAGGAATAEQVSSFASDVHYYLSQDPRQLPSYYLYDALGSSLFDAICQLPWYKLPRAEARLLDAHARDVFTAGAPITTIVELGPGNATKLARLIAAADGARGPLDVHLIDVSGAALAQAIRTLSPLGDLRVVSHEATYEVGLARFKARRAGAARTLMLFLGSNIGNFDPPGCEAFLRAMRIALARGDALLIGADLVKPERDLLLAYDDPLGVTAAFNKNLLVRINGELGGSCDIDAFAHSAIWNAAHRRIEMHLVSRRAQRVTIPAAHLDFQIAEGETIWTESSYKFEPGQINALLGRCGFRVSSQWVDAADGFALTLADAA